jgi:3-methyladenine DNA glycosylase AlkD
VSWALRQIGKRTFTLHGKAVDLAKQLSAGDSHSARWIGRDALRELTDKDTLKRLRAGGGRS